MKFEAEEMRVRITFTEEVLGASSANPEVHREFIASKAPDAPSREEEVAAIGVEAETEKTMTIFPKLEDGTPFMWDYQVRGFFKDSCGVLRRVTGSESEKIKNYKREIDGLIFVKERKIPFIGYGEIGNNQRALRAETAQGPRVALANSETVPAGTTAEFTVQVFKKADMAAIREWLDYGQFRGFLQWRNSGKGRFVWQELDGNGNVIGGNYEEVKGEKK